MSAQPTLPALPIQEGVEFRHVVGFLGYAVGDDGSLWSCWRNGGDDRTGQILTNTWRRLKGWVDRRRGKPTGYLKVGLMREGRLYRLCLHHLILEAFAGPRPAGMQARHLDDDKSNNRLSNLVWGTRTENAQDAYRNGVMPVGEDHCRAKLTAEDVRLARRLLAEGLSERRVASGLGVSKGTIRAIKLGRTWKGVG